MKTLPHITTKQQEILKLLYRHRFLNRIQIQAFLHHKDKGLSSKWLKDLKEKQYIAWIYDADDFAEKTKPAIYYLGLNGIRYLNGRGDYPVEELRKRYKDATRKSAFIARCLLLADCGLHLDARNKSDAGITRTLALEADYIDEDSDFYFLSESEFIHPHLVFNKEEEADEDITNEAYFVEVFDLTTPHYMVRKKLGAYVEYLQSGEWEGAKGDEELPTILIACPTLAELIYAKRYVRKQLNDAYGDEIPDEVKVRFSTIENIRSKGITAVIWEDV